MTGSDEEAYLAAKHDGDLVGCVRALLGMTVLLAQDGEGRNLVAGGGTERYLLAYTSEEWLARAGEKAGAAGTLPRDFLQLVRGWSDPQLGLGVNAYTQTEVRIPARLMPTVRELPETRAALAAADAQTRAGGGSSPATPVAPIDVPHELRGYRFARALDDVVDGRAVLAPSRGTVDDPAERRRILDYLRAGAPLMAMSGKVTDLVDPAKGQVVGGGTRTDGRWVWSEAVGYYLTTYGIAPEPAFYQAIAGNGYRCPEVPRATLRGAGEALREQHRIAAEQIRAWRDRGDS
ncbi:MAG: hypothetical protein ACRDT6_18905 [Micromonosporaceae bacterium]